MTRPDLSAHDRAAVRMKGARIVADLTALALDPATGLQMIDRMALAVLALSVEVEIARCTGGPPPLCDQLPKFAAALTRIERQTIVRRG